MEYTVVIPARLASSRLFAKPLSDIAGAPLIQHVYECAQRSQAQQIIVATDDVRVMEVVQGFGGLACMTDVAHRSGTDRLAEVVRLKGFTDDHIVVNLQGDEPLMPAAVIDQVAANLATQTTVNVATVSMRILTTQELMDPHIVKVVSNQAGYAMYFSRAPIAWDRENAPLQTPIQAHNYQRHIGLYAFRAGFLTRFTQWEPCPPERIELLEQLRVLWYGEKIHVAEACERPGPGVDTDADLIEVRRLILASRQ